MFSDSSKNAFNLIVEFLFYYRFLFLIQNKRRPIKQTDVPVLSTGEKSSRFADGPRDVSRMKNQRRIKTK